MSAGKPATGTGSSADFPAIDPTLGDAGALGRLPRLSIAQARLDARLSRLGAGEGVETALGWMSGPLGRFFEVGRPEVVGRPSGLRRVGLVAELAWPRLNTRIGVGVETPAAHAVVDRLLGFERLPPERRLPLSPVEWGILTFVLAETLRRLSDASPCPFGVWDPTIDRVGADPFDISGLGRVLTIRWPITLGAVAGSIRLWLSESLTARWLQSTTPPPSGEPLRVPFSRVGDFSSVWRAEAGAIALPRGLATLRPRGVLPLTASPLSGTPESPVGTVALAVRFSGRTGRYAFPAEPVPHSGGGRLILTAPPRFDPTFREPLAMNPSSHASNAEPTPPTPADMPVTLVVELGRINLSLGRVADLKTGDVVELGRHSRETVELTSGGRLVARGELVLIDTELGVRVTQVFL